MPYPQYPVLVRFVFITGTDTGVGKTVATVLLTRHLRAIGMRIRAVKPFCSGGREDAEALFAAQSGELTLDDINPWFFKAPLTPLLAARRAGRTIELTETVEFLRRASTGADVVLIEGAGGLLSPLGEGFCARELIRKLRATPLVVCPNRLGAINQGRLVFNALDAASRSRAQLLLVRALNPDTSAPGNLDLLRELLGDDRVHQMPHLLQPATEARIPKIVSSLAERLVKG